MSRSSRAGSGGPPEESVPDVITRLEAGLRKLKKKDQQEKKRKADQREKDEHENYLQTRNVRQPQLAFSCSAPKSGTLKGLARPEFGADQLHKHPFE